MKRYDFWNSPDWSGGTNLRDPGNQPFWMLDPLPFAPEPVLQRPEQPKIELIGLEWRNWKPRRSLRCRLGVHKFLSYCGKPWQFKCHRCGCLKDLGPDPQPPKPEPAPVKCTHFSCSRPAVAMTSETSGYCTKHNAQPYCRGEYCFNKRDDSTSLWCKKCDSDPVPHMPKDRHEHQFGVPGNAPCKFKNCGRPRTFGSLLCKQHLADHFDKTYLEKNPNAKPCVMLGCKRPRRPIRGWDNYCIDHAPTSPPIKDRHNYRHKVYCNSYGCMEKQTKYSPFCSKHSGV